MHVWYIHGANATPLSFQFLKLAIYKHTFTDIKYDASKEPIQEIVNRLAGAVDRDIHIVGHSLGGIIASAIAQAKPEYVKSVTTISTPFGGSELANLMGFVWPFHQFLNNIKSNNPVVSGVRQKGAAVPTLSIITTACSNPFELRKNDGVVTVASQLDFTGADQVELELNHFEALLSSDVAAEINTHIRWHDKISYLAAA